ncbi:hypothetical protein [uncultured Maritimibacter sp.]|jgi:hypothetical protein|uniref:hypothetical protein n=1 Tax=uncultured Maritimibacter sp. TaxID=991866 RepID=UPI002609B9C5|nr:hypothetical protein [uncultured Maritimibacter sp.]
MAPKTYIVKRPHQGDRWYDQGDERVAHPGEVDHLVAAGVLVESGAEDGADDKKAKKAPKNKAAPKPANQAVPSAETKVTDTSTATPEGKGGATPTDGEGGDAKPEGEGGAA